VRAQKPTISVDYTFLPLLALLTATTTPTAQMGVVKHRKDVTALARI